MIGTSLLLLQLLSAAPPAESDVHAFLNAPITALGESVGSVTGKLGEPESVSFELTQNVHDPKMKDVHISLSYPGLRVTVLVVICCDKSLVESVRVSEPRWANHLGIVWPATADDARHQLGPPSSEKPASMLYKLENEVGTDTIRFELSGRAVSMIEWRYSVD
jgi:hypothetical protein